jgi:hypothetical protein
MSTDIIYQKTPSSEVSKAMLAQAASLFSSSYGIWGPLAEEKMGPFAKQGNAKFEDVERVGTDKILRRASENDSVSTRTAMSPERNRQPPCARSCK